MQRKEKPPKKTRSKRVSMHFLRWGTLGPQRHEEAKLPSDSKDRRFHTAPRVWGFYAFSRGFTRLWLLTGGNPSIHKKNGRFHWLKDEHGKKVCAAGQDENLFFDDRLYKHEVRKYSKREKMLKRINKINCNYVLIETTYEEGGPKCYYYERPKHFCYAGDLWHHLEFFKYEQCNTDDENWVYKKIRLVPEDEVMDRCGDWVKTSMRTYRRALYKYNNFLRYYTQNYWCSPKNLERNKKYWINHDDEEFLEVFIEKL